MLTRRTVAAGGALLLLSWQGAKRSCAASTRAPHTRGCLLADEDVDRIYPAGTDTRLFITGDEPMIPKSGDRDFDFALAQTLAKISEVFGVLPGFAYYDDYDGKNAYATKRNRLNRGDGTVLMGIDFLHALKQSREYPEVAVVSVCAHEFAHVLQFRHGLDDKLDTGQPNVKKSELQADYLAGYYVGLLKRERPTYPAAVAAMTQFNFGDVKYATRNHHGTPDERGAAVVKGFEASFRQNKNLNDANQESTEYVQRL